MFQNLDSLDAIILLLGYIALLGTSGVVVKRVLSGASKAGSLKNVTEEEKGTGFIVGKCENILIITFVILEAYTALALVFAAKAIVRREDMSKNSLFFLAGTMVNVTYSIVIAVVIKLLILAL
ncbi:MAG: hypothetical protein QCI38_07865 [Candidatus Thermoplasmatota archaeon]|nr:hypothetical protein [Candidatus Thermoplasmatota archaeon]